VCAGLSAAPDPASLVRATAFAVLVLSQSVLQVAAPGSRTPPCHLECEWKQDETDQPDGEADEDRSRARDQEESDGIRGVAPEPPGFIASVPENGQGTAPNAIPHFRQTGRRSSRIPALLYPPPDFLRIAGQGSQTRDRPVTGGTEGAVKSAHNLTRPSHGRTASEARGPRRSAHLTGVLQNS